MIFTGSMMLGAEGCVDVLGRVPRDVDIVCMPDEFLPIIADAEPGTLKKIDHKCWNKWFFSSPVGTYIEVEIGEPGSYWTAYRLHSAVLSGKYRMIDILYTVKMSHRYLKDSPAFWKTRADIMNLRKHSAKIFDDEWYKLRMKETYWYKHPSLQQSKDEFFDGDGVTYHYDHDWIHQQVAIGARPAYTYYLKDGGDVECDRAKWDALDLQNKLRGVAEEAAVLAYERSVIPFGTNFRKIYPYALMKVCTSITSGWFREFAWENYDRVVKMVDQLPIPEVEVGLEKEN